MNGSWSFREFITFCSPLSQYSLKAKDLSTALVLGDEGKKGKESDDKLQIAETSSTSSLGELNALIKKRGGKENKVSNAGAFSRATKSTAAMSYAGGVNDSFNKGK